MPAFGDIGPDLTETMRRFLANLTGYFFGFLDPDFFVGISVTVTISRTISFFCCSQISRCPPKLTAGTTLFSAPVRGFAMIPV